MSDDPYFDLFMRAMEPPTLGLGYMGWEGKRNMTVDEAMELLAEAGDVYFAGRQAADLRDTFERWAEGDDFSREHMIGSTASMDLRRRCAYRWSFAVTDPGTSAWLAGMGPLVEIGAGTGWWAHRITEAGGDVKAYDKAPTGRARQNFYHPGAERWFDVKQGGTSAAKRHSDRILFLCWPPYDEPMGAEAVLAYEGDRVVLIGEGQGGCTGDDVLFELLGTEHECSGTWSDDETCEHNLIPPLFKLVEERTICQWTGMHDRVTVYERLP